uniref:MARVEL domain-containing protein n=1 Tax=Strigamia maritima TaxID=126957 RepID=T1IY96_STRMM
MASVECCKRASMKIIQIALNVISIALILKYNCVPTIGPNLLKFDISSDYTRTYFVVAVAGGFCIVSTVILLAYAIEGMSKAPILETLFMVVGAAVSITAGGLIVEYFVNYHTNKDETRDAGISFGSLQLINGLVYLIDAFFVFKK